MSSVTTPRFWRTAYSSSPKSSPTGPTTRTSQKKLAASEKCTADPPSMRSRSPNGVLTASKAMDPTTTRLIGGGGGSPPPRGGGWCSATAGGRAVVMRGGGGAGGGERGRVPAPPPADGEALIEVALAGVNFADTHARED